MRLIGLAVVLAVGLALVPVEAHTQPTGNVGSVLGVPNEIRRVVGESLSFEIRGLAARRLAEAAKEAAAAMVEVPVVKMAAAG
jgi:hypothetical protein